MNDTQLDELVAYFAEEFTRLADAARPYRGITRSERTALVKWLHLEFRRLAKTDGDKHSCVIVDTRRFAVPVAPAPVSFANIPPALVPPAGGRLMVAPGVPATYVGTAKPHSRHVELN